MDCPGSEQTWAFCKVNFERHIKGASILWGPGACSPGKIFKILDSPLAQLSYQTGHPLCTNCSNSQSIVTYGPRKAFLE